MVLGERKLRRMVGDGLIVGDAAENKKMRDVYECGAGAEIKNPPDGGVVGGCGMGGGEYVRLASSHA